MSTLYAALTDRLLVVRGAGEWEVAERLVGSRLECVAASPAAPERIFVGTVEDGLQYSTDGGYAWTTAGEFGARVTSVTVSPHDPDVVWVGTEPSAVYRSDDGGDTWQACGDLTAAASAGRWSFPPRPTTHHVRWIAVNPHDPAHVYVAIEAGAFLRSLDCGETWEDHPADARRDNHTLAVHPDAPCRVYVAAGDGYAESPDCGDTWRYPQDGLAHRYVWGLAVDSGDPDTVVVSAAQGPYRAHRVATAESYVYRHTGEGWEPAMEGLPGPEGMARAVLAAGDPGEFFALTNRGLFRSGDGARTWDQLQVPWQTEYAQVGRGLAVV